MDHLLRDELGLGRRQALKDTSLADTPDRDAQFRIITDLRKHYELWNLPIISIDTKKKELLGNFHRPGACHTSGFVHTWDHDFGSHADGKVIPYGVYDVRANEGFMLLAQGSDTGQLVCDAIRLWWNRMGRYRYDGAYKMLVLADSGGSNGYRNTLFREELWKLSGRLGFKIQVAHLPSYCSKYNPIDHRMFCHVSRALKGVIFRSIQTIRDAVARTKTSTGLKVKAAIANKVYPKGIKASEQFILGDFISYNEDLPKYNYCTTNFIKSGSYC